jgi:hypothetical protein
LRRRRDTDLGRESTIHLCGLPRPFRSGRRPLAARAATALDHATMMPTTKIPVANQPGPGLNPRNKKSQKIKGG